MFTLHCELSSDLEQDFNITVRMVPLVFSPSPCPWYLESGVRSGVSSVPEIYVEIYIYDDVYVRLLMMSYFRTSGHFVR